MSGTRTEPLPKDSLDARFVGRVTMNQAGADGRDLDRHKICEPGIGRDTELILVGTRRRKADGVVLHDWKTWKP